MGLTVVANALLGGGDQLTAEVVLFWVFAVLALGSALAVVTMRNIVHGALMLVINLLAIAGLYLTLESSFLSIIQVLVYAGAIMVLFLFVIMLLGVNRDDLLIARSLRTRVLAIVAGVALSGALLLAFVGPYTTSDSICGPDATETVAGDGTVRCIGLAERLGDDTSGVAFLGRQLFTRYTFPFELSALLLTVATIGAVILARRRDLEPEDLDPEGPDSDGPDSDGPERSGRDEQER
ncbi:MAG: NADH-quinone oxidoreductase subunit J [Nitriliruptoraceae bacterium]